MDTSTPEQVSKRPNLSQATQLVAREARGDPAKVTGPADTQVESGQQNMPSDTRSEPRNTQNGEYIATGTADITCADVRDTDREPDPFGQIFAGIRMAKLPNRPLGDLGSRLMKKAETMGAPMDDNSTVYWGAACITAMQAGLEPRTCFFGEVCLRLSLCAEKAERLAEFLAILFPGLSCEKTAGGYRVKRDGKWTSWRGSVSAQYYVESFIEREGVRWQSAGREGSQEGQGSSPPPDQLLQPRPQAASLARKEDRKKRSWGEALLDSLSPVRVRRKLDNPRAPSESPDKDKDERSRNKDKDKRSPDKDKDKRSWGTRLSGKLNPRKRRGN